MRPISFSLHEEQLAKLDRVAKLFGKNRSFIVQEFINGLPDPVETSLKLTRPNVVFGCNTNLVQAADVMGGFIGRSSEEMLNEMGKNHCGLVMLLELAMAGENLLIRATTDE